MRQNKPVTRVSAWVCAACAACAALAQTTNPVYVDDSPAAADTLARAPQLAASGNAPEAVRALQRVLEEEPDRVAPETGPGADPDVFTGVRRRVHLALLSDPALLEEYRRTAEPRAAELLAAGDAARVEQSFLLTPSGFRAALRMAQAQMEAAGFESARLTLEQLRDHPDRRGPAGRDAAAMLRRLAAYINRAEVWALADQWSAEAGLTPQARAAVSPPPAAALHPLTPLDASAAAPGPLEANIPPSALWSVAVEDKEVTPSDQDETRFPGPSPQSNAARNDQQLWIFPAVVGDTLLVNNGTSIRAWDRFTLEPRWAVQPPPDVTLSRDEAGAAAEERQSRRPSQREDTAGVTVSGRIVLAVTGVATDGLRLGDDRVHAVDLGTGRLLWSAAPWSGDAALDQASARGPVLAGEGLAIVAVRKSVQPRRVISMYLVGMDLRTGAERWARLIASAGALPNQRDRRVADSGVLDGGVVYVTDPVGVVAAVEAATGRPIWVRRVPSSSVNYAGGPMGQMWESSGPVVAGGSVFILSTDHENVLQLDRATGRLLAARPGDQLVSGKPKYLLGAAGVLVAVGRDALGFVSMDHLSDGPVRLSGRIENVGGIRGRVVASAGMLLVPTIDGATIIDPASPRPPRGDVPLDKSGILLPAGDQIVAVDDREIRSYLGWDAADRLLTARMAANPDDPRPAVSYADLAYRAGRPGGIAGAADRALSAIEHAPGSAGNQAARARLFASLREMVEVAEDSWAAPALPVAAAPPVSPKTNLPPAAVDDLVARLGRAAASHEDRVVYLLCLGRVREALGTPALAVEAYQGVLTEPALASAPWASLAEPALARTGAAEASRRLRSLVIAAGRGVYTAFDAEVEAELAGANAQAAQGPALEALARKYPVARAATQLWERAADAYGRSGSARAQIEALGAALEAAETSLAIGPAPGAAPPGPDDPAAELGGAAGRLVRALQRAGRAETAAQTFARVRAAWPGADLNDGGATLDAGALARDLDTARAAPARLARIGADVGPQDQQFPDWSLLRPLDPGAPTGSPEHVVMASEALGKVALFGVDFGEDGSGPGRGLLRELWSRPYQDQAPVLVRSDPGAVYLAWLDPDGGAMTALERIDPVGGKTVWRIDSPGALMPADPTLPDRATEAGSVTRLETRQGPRAIMQIIVLIDGDSVALVERTGRLVVLDALTGRRRAAAVSPVPMVFDATAAGGVLALAGAVPPARPSQDEPAPVGAAYDLHSGALLTTFTGLPDQVRWLRITPRGLVLLAHRSEIVAHNPSDGREVWAMQCAESRDAWVFDSPGLEDAIFLRTDPEGLLFRGSLADGSVDADPVDALNHLDAISRIDGIGLAGRAALMNSKGVVLLSPAGAVVGIDALEGGDDLLVPLASEDLFVTVQTQQVMLPDERPSYRLSLLSTSSAALRAAYDLVLWAVPTRAAVVDGRILVTAGRMTVAYPAPGLERQAEQQTRPALGADPGSGVAPGTP